MNELIFSTVNSKQEFARHACNMLGLSAEDLLSVLVENDIVTRDGVQQIMYEKKLQFITDNHSHEIWKGDDGRWRTYLPDDTKPKKRRLVSRATEKALVDMLYEYYTDSMTRKKRSCATLRTIYPEWIEYRSALVEESTIMRNHRTWKSMYENDEIVDKPIQEINKINLESWIAKKTKGMNEHQYNNFILIIKGILEYAVEYEIIQSNPYNRICKTAIHKQLVPECKKPSQYEVFTFEERNALIEHAYKQYEENRYPVQRFVPLAIVCLLNTTMRRGEISALRFDNIIGSNQILLDDSFSADSKKLKGRLKGSRPERVITATQNVINLIEFIKEERKRLGMPIDGYIFPVDDRLKSFYSALGKAINAYCEELHINIRSVHKTRKTVASLMRVNGVDDLTIQEELGHDSFKVSSRSYLYSMDTIDRKVESISHALS